MPARLEIDGGVQLQGTVRVSAARNAALPALAASLLTADRVQLTNVPDLDDVRTMVRLIERLGDRGYERLETKRGALGARIERRR
jgi:UDP-N-acetylglucosamine 1-carboxyvinyltransferase